MVALVVGHLSLDASPAAAHSPHDDVYDLAISPDFESDATVLAASRGLLLRSRDGGRSWNRLVRGLDHRGRFAGVAFAGGSALEAYAISSDAAFRSVDGGSSWRRVHTAPADDLTFLAASPTSGAAAIIGGPSSGTSITLDGGQSWRSLGASSARITAAAFAPDSARVILAGDASGGLHLTTDAGRTWRHQSVAGAGAVTAIAFSPTYGTDGQALIGTSTGGVRTWDLATRVASPTVGLTDPRVTSIAYSAAYGHDHTVLASTWDAGVFVSTDEGKSWRAASSGLRKDRQADQAGYDRPHFGEVVTAWSGQARRTPVALLAGFTGVYLSRDQGSSWQQQAPTQSPAIVEGLALSPELATDGRVAVMTYVNGARTSTDRGATWQVRNEGLAQPGYWAAAPTSYLRGFNIAISPTRAGRQWMFLGSDPGVFRSSDGGASWELTEISGFANPRTTTAPVAPRVLVSPRFAVDGTVLMVDTVAGDVYRSQDEGATFARVGRIPNSVHCLQAAPTFSTDRRLLACTGAGVFVSTDLGTTWTATARLLMYDLAVASSPGQPETWFAATHSGLRRSTDRGRTWTPVRLPGPALDGPIAAVAASPPSASAATVIVSSRGKGLYRSTDGGVTFQRVARLLLVGNEQPEPYPYRNTGSAIVFSPAFASDRTVFGYSHTRVLRSTDGGSSWQRLTPPVATHSGPFPAGGTAPSG